MPAAPSAQIPPVYHHLVGDIQVTALSDGTLERSLELLRSIQADEAQKLLADAFRPGVVISVNAFVLRSNGRSILIETGSGKYLGESAGHLLANMSKVGISPASIDTILLTASYALFQAGNPAPLVTGRLNASKSFDRTLQRFAALRAARDAENSAAKVLAEQIRNRIAIFLSERT